VLLLMGGFLFLIYRGLMIAAEGPTLFARLLAGAITAGIVRTARERDRAVAAERASREVPATLWSDLDPAADRAKQVIAGLKGGGDFRTSDLKADLERALAEAAASGPRLGEAFLELNRALASEPDKAATFKLVQSLAQPYPNNPEANFAVALAAFNTGLTDFESATAALQAIDRALAQKPEWEQAMLLKVEILGKQSLDRAADYLSEILKSAPDSKPANSALVQVRIQQKRYADAIQNFEHVVARDPAHSQHEIWREVAATYIAAGQFEDARTALDQFLDHRPSDPEGLYLMGRAHAGLGHKREATSLMHACIEAVKTAPAYKYRASKRWLNEAQQFIKSSQ